MKAEKISKSPNGDGLPGQKEDLLERRRLQNRLSQRNHRRKIRDRIAKLQERVIANELRASAALNGWDQHYMPSPLLSNRHVSHSHFNMSPRDHLATDPSAQYSHSYIPTVPWSRDMALNSPLGLMGDRACFLDGSFPTWPKCSSPSASDWTEISGINTLGGLSEDTFQGLFTTGESLPIKSPNNLDQPLYYVATGEHIQNRRNKNYAMDVNHYELKYRNSSTSNSPSAKRYITPIQDHSSCPSRLRLGSRSRISFTSTNTRKRTGAIVTTADKCNLNRGIPVSNADRPWDMFGSWILCAGVSIAQDAESP
ncbi:hypothetical protein N7476_001962 [Penicillium atrosanguineum]|uniref:BZIP domain-containing protein n=1 Tax=Penicillium atrosanguineum TaxID=1132637 RepID=A0A9W9Q5N9_9EURO|nr:hypothetical protein N7526_006196 [Penicillium atrosanguineum]KAJ5323362.1 hypothetical protein N7476_001962 [Penicillium atrosanguineum]